MRKLIGVAIVAWLAMSYVADPTAVKTGLGGVTALGRDIFRAAVGAAGDVGASGESDGHIIQLPDGSFAKVPPGYVLPTDSIPKTKP